jgi:hypothetical protein
VMRNPLFFFRGNFIGSDIETPVDLHGITVDDFAGKELGQFHRCCAFPDSGGSEDTDEIFFVRWQF